MHPWQESGSGRGDPCTQWSGPVPLSPEEPNPLTPFPMKEGGTEKMGGSTLRKRYPDAGGWNIAQRR
jgi:hypothetical protein